jgi:hypothetical protein
MMIQALEKERPGGTVEAFRALVKKIFLSAWSRHIDRFVFKLFPLLITCFMLTGCAPARVPNPAPVPPELSIEEHALTQQPEPEYAQLYFAEGSQEDILAKHSDERAQTINFMDRSCNADNHFGQCMLLGSDKLVAWDEYSSGLFHRGKVILTRNGSRIYQISVGDSSPLASLRGLWTYDGHWALESAYVTTYQLGNVIDSQASGQISIDGKLLNKQLGYQEAFGFQTLHNKPFYFFKRHGEIGIDYQSVEISLGYSEILHYGCCSAAMLNPHVSQNMVAFFARKDSTWYYVEVGVFGQNTP